MKRNPLQAGGDAGLAQETPQDFEVLFHQHWDRVFNLLLRLTGDRYEADDLALEVFWRLYQQPPRKGPGENPAGWLYRVATNLGYNALRARKRRQQYEERAGKFDLEQAESTNPAAEAEKSLELALVRRVLAEIKPRSAQVLLLRHSGLSYGEIARALNVSPGSVGTLLARAEKDFEKRYQALERRTG